MKKTDIFGMSVAELQDALSPFEIPAYRAKQMAKWMYQAGVQDFSKMTNLPKDLRERLAEKFVIGMLKLKRRLDSKDGRTTKFLLEFYDGIAVEAVLMRQPYGNSICVSTQAGCSMGCAFCASTLHGLTRDLTAGEILSEAVYINDMLRVEGEKVSTCVIMGAGEPLINYDNVLAYVHRLHDQDILGMSYRSITLSTSGIVPAMYRLADEGIPISLSVSLHAPYQTLRERIMPIAKKYAIGDVVAAAKHYADATKRRVTYEYILIDHLTDGEEEARHLVKLLRGQLASVNLIPINPVEERGLLRPSERRIDAFGRYLRTHHIEVTLRREMGADINAACGQLRNKYLGKEVETIGV